MNISYAVVSAFERTKSHKGEKASRHVFTVALLVVFFVALIGSLAAGVSVYRNVAAAHAQTSTMRAESSLIASLVRANDTADAVSRGQGPQGPALVLTERLDTGTYEMRIYAYQGAIVQEYSIAGTAYTPERAQQLVTSERFEFTLSGSLITVTTDSGRFDISLRSAQTAADQTAASQTTADQAATGQMAADQARADTSSSEQGGSA